MDPKTGRREERADFVFVAPDLARRVVNALVLLAIGGLSVGVTLSLSDRQPWTLVLTAVSAACLLMCWALLQASTPQRVTVRGPHIVIRRDGVVHEFDLEDPNVDIRVRDGEIAFAYYQDRWVEVRARDVDWKVFSDVVMYYQNKADHNAEERDRRFSR